MDSSRARRQEEELGEKEAGAAAAGPSQKGLGAKAPAGAKRMAAAAADRERQDTIAADANADGGCGLACSGGGRRSGGVRIAYGCLICPDGPAANGQVGSE